MRRDGFTLIELVVAIAILAVIASIVYACFASVVNSAQITRGMAEEMRLRRFLTQSLEINLATLCGPATIASIYGMEGISEDGPYGPRDALRFFSTAPLMGGLALPGDLKEVRYEVLDPYSEQTGLGAEQPVGREDAPQLILQATETPVLAGNLQTYDPATGEQDLEVATGYEAPSWSVPVRTLDITYYDGEEWVEEWNSGELLCFPWFVRVRINFAKPQAVVQAEATEHLDPEEDPDFEMIIPIPVGLATTPWGGT